MSLTNDLDTNIFLNFCNLLFFEVYTLSALMTQTNLINMDFHSESTIGNFYNGRSVFITGATGFMGKVRLIN